MNESKKLIPKGKETPDDPRMMMFYIPEDQDIQAVVGMISYRHSHLDYTLRMTIKTLTNVTIKEALDATKYEGSALLRKRVRKLAGQRLGEGKPLIQLQALLMRCERATQRRNDLIHNISARELDGEPFVQTENHEWKPMPKIDSLVDLWDELTRLTQEVNAARLDGFLFKALNGNKLAKNENC